MSAASFEQNLEEFLQKPDIQRVIRSRGIQPSADSAYKKFGVLQEQPQDMRGMFPIRDRVDAFLGGLAGGPSFDITPGGDQRRARKGLSSEDVKRLIDANPDFGGQIEGMYLPGPKATPFFKKA